MLNNRIFLLEMHAVLISCFSGSIRASSVTEVVLLYSVSYGGNRTPSDPQLQNDTNEAQKFYLYILLYRRANVKIRSTDGSMSEGGRRKSTLRPCGLYLFFIVLYWNDRAKDFTQCVFHLVPGNPS